MILVIAMLIAPGATAFLLTRRFHSMVLLALCMSLLSAFLGVYLSFFIDSAPAPTIILIMMLKFIAVFCYTSYKNRKVEFKSGDTIEQF